MKDQWIDWLQDKQRHFFYGVMIVVATLFIAFQLFGKFHQPRAKGYLSANQAYEKWIAQDEAFEKLEQAIKSQPELAAKFGALIADRFIGSNRGEKAEPFAQDVFQRVLKHTPEHTAFAEVSLLISKGKFQEALQQALALKGQLPHNSILYGFNLIRIASLYRALDLHEQEVVALEELEQYLKNGGETAQVLSDCFQEGNTTLTDYISQRKG